MRENATRIVGPLIGPPDEAFIAALYDHFGDEPFVRGNLDAGRLSWVFGREVVPAEEPFDPESYDAMLRLDLEKARANFPDAFPEDERF